jgi:hypothetical protein
VYLTPRHFGTEHLIINTKNNPGAVVESVQAIVILNCKENRTYAVEKLFDKNKE